MKKAVVSFVAAAFLLLVGSWALPADIFGSDPGEGAVETAADKIMAGERYPVRKFFAYFHKMRISCNPNAVFGVLLYEEIRMRFSYGNMQY